MSDRERHIYRVQSGGHTQWFLNREDAKQYADDRFEYDFDGIPFLESIPLTEVIYRLNQLDSLEEFRSA